MNCVQQSWDQRNNLISPYHVQILDDQNYIEWTNHIDKCKHQCPLSCQQILYDINVKNNGDIMNSDSNLTIRNSEHQEFTYEAQPIMSFSELLSNIGGLFGLYFGLSFVDINQLIKKLLFNLRTFFNRLLHFQIDKLKLFILRFFRQLSFINIVIVRLELIDWKTIVSLVSIPFLSSQIYGLLIDYFEYSTETSYEFIAYNLINQKFMINEFPAITVCTKHMFERLFWDKNFVDFNGTETFLHNVNDKYSDQIWLDHFHKNLSSTNPYVRKVLKYYNYCLLRLDNYKPIIDYLAKHFDVNTKLEFDDSIARIENISAFGLKATKDLLDFYANHYYCQTLYNPKINCNDIKPTVTIVSSLGKCHTYLMGESNRTDLAIDKLVVYDGKFIRVPYYLKQNIFVHSPDHLPIPITNEIAYQDTDIKGRSSFAFMLSKYIFSKLPLPYDTKCHDYGKGNQFDCLNRCFMEAYLDKLSCLPTSPGLFTINLSDEHQINQYSFCSNQSIDSIMNVNKKIKPKCDHICEVPCIDVYYKTEFIPVLTMERYNSKTNKGHGLYFQLRDQFYWNVKWSPKVTFFNLIISLMNILGFWHGFSFSQCLEFLKSLITRIIVTIEVHLKFKNYFKKYQLTFAKNLILVYCLMFLVHQMIMVTINYVGFETNSRMRLEEDSHLVDDLYLSIIIYKSGGIEGMARYIDLIRKTFKFAHGQPCQSIIVVRNVSSVDSDLLSKYIKCHNITAKELTKKEVMCGVFIGRGYRFECGRHSLYHNKTMEIESFAYMAKEKVPIQQSFFGVVTIKISPRQTNIQMNHYVSTAMP